MEPRVTACPPGFKSPASEAGVAAYLAELLRLSPAQLRGVGIDLRKRLGATTLSGTDTYSVPSDQDLVVYGITGYYRSSALATEPVLNANFTQFSPAELQLARLSNVIATLENKDRNLPVFDARGVHLSAITPPLGSKLVFPVQAPLLFPATHTVKATFAIQDTTAAVVGNDADYGLILEGILIPKRV